MRLQLLACIAGLFAACNNAGEANKKGPGAEADSLLDQVLRQHNIGMAKMQRVDEEKSKLQHVSDSISKLSYDVQEKLAVYRTQLDSAFNRLTFAGYAMEKWMNEFNMDSLKDNETQRVKYLQSEDKKIINVNEVMTHSLQKADSVLKESR